MNTKRIFFWLCFIVVLGLIVWGLIAAMDKQSAGPLVGDPAPVTSADHTKNFGTSTPVVTMIEYADFQCPACGAYYPLIKHVLASSTVPIQVVYRHFPLPQHPNAPLAAQASEAASMQGHFWEMYDILFENQASWQDVPDPHEIFVSYAQRLGLNTEKFRTDIDSETVKNIVAKNKQEGVDIGINQTPTFFLNGKAIDNPQSYEQFQTAIEQAAR